MDNDEFIALDERAFGDGQTDSTTQPLSTYKENRLNLNTEFLVKRPQNTTWNYDVDKDFGVKTGSYFWTTRFLQSITLNPNDTKVEITLNGEVGLNSIKEGVVRVRGKILTASDDSTGAVAETEPEEWVEGLGPHTLTIDIESSALLATTPCIVMLDAQTKDLGPMEGSYQKPDEAQLESKFAIGGKLREALVGGGSLGPLNGGQAVRISDALTEGEFYDITARRVLTKGKELDPWVALQNFGDAPNAADITPGTVEIYNISYLKQLGWSYRVISDPRKASGSYTPHSQLEMLAQQPIIGQHTSKHGINSDYVHKTPRICGMGPTNGGYYNATWSPGSNKSVWKFAPGDAWGAEQINTLDTISISTLGDAKRLKVQGFAFAVHAGGFWGGSLHNANRVFTNKEDVYHGKVDWTMKISASQITGGTIQEFAYEDFYTELDLYQVGPSVNRPFLRQLYFSFYTDVFAPGGAGHSFELTRKPNSLLKSGVLFEDDFEYLRPFEATIDLQDADFNPEWPVQISIKAFLTYRDDYRLEDSVDISNLNREKVFLGLHSYNITTEPL